MQATWVKTSSKKNVCYNQQVSICLIMGVLDKTNMIFLKQGLNYETSVTCEAFVPLCKVSKVQSCSSKNYRSFVYAAAEAITTNTIFSAESEKKKYFLIKNKSRAGPDLLCSSPPCLLIPAILLDPPEEWGEWLKLLEFEGDAGLLANVGNLTGLLALLIDVWKTKRTIIFIFLRRGNKDQTSTAISSHASSETSTEEHIRYLKQCCFRYTNILKIYLYKHTMHLKYNIHTIMKRGIIIT